MRIKAEISIIGFLFSAAAASAQAPAAAPTEVAGKWRTAEDAIVEIGPCGESVCGVLTWFPELEEEENPILDANNPDPALSARELQGIEMVWGFSKTKKGWRKGQIYDPNSGKTYRSKLTRLDRNSLKVEGCVGPFCRRYVWTRIEAASAQAF